MKALLLIGMGGHALMGQVLLIRELLVVLSGHEICLGILFASWFMGIFVGAWAGGWIQRAFRDATAPFVWSQAGAVILAPALVLGIRLLRGWAVSSPGVPLPLLPTVLASWVLVMPLSLVVGMLFPVACGMFVPPARGPVGIIGRVYVLEALGSLLAGVLLTYVLLGEMDSVAILAAGGIIMLATATALLVKERSRGAMPMGLLALLWAVTWASGGVKGVQSASIQARWEAIHPGMARMNTQDSLYQSVEVGRVNGQYSIFGNGHLLATFPDPHGAAPLAHLLMNQQPYPKDVLLVGGGPGSLLPIILNYPVDHVRVLELDPVVFRIAEPYLASPEREALNDPRVRVSFVDGRYGIRRLPPGSLDAVLLQVPDPATALLNRYHTLEFFRDLKRVLRQNGLVLTSVTGSLQYVGEEVGGYVATIHRTLREVFDEVLLIPGDRVMLLASTAPGLLTMDPEILARRMEYRGIRDDHFPPEAFSSLIQEGPAQLWRHALARHEGAVNRDAQPAAYLRFLALWDLLTERRLEPSPLRHLTGLSFSWVLGACVALVGVALAAGARPAARRTSLMVIAVTGFVGMAQEILCLYMYQARLGYLYSRLGMIVALFMAGLALGGWLAARWRPASRRPMLGALLAAQGLLMVLCAAIPLGWVPVFFDPGRQLMSEALFESAVGAWMVLVGVGTGATFCLACGLLGQEEAAVGKVAGLINGCDHLGAALGALLPATFLVPALGLAQTGLLLVVLQGGAVLLALLNLLDLGRGGG